jgi:hypothetical protein
MNLSYDVFINEPPPQDNGLLPNGDPKGGSPVASTGPGHLRCLGRVHRTI